MLEHLENFDLPHGGFFDNLVFLWFFEFFDGHNISIIITLALKNDSIGSFAYHAHNIILLHINFYHYNSLSINFNQILEGASVNFKTFSYHSSSHLSQTYPSVFWQSTLKNLVFSYFMQILLEYDKLLKIGNGLTINFWLNDLIYRNSFMQWNCCLWSCQWKDELLHFWEIGSSYSLWWHDASSSQSFLIRYQWKSNYSLW